MDIVVTAQKREENLQNVPISLTVLDEAQIEKLRVLNIDDFIETVANVSFADEGPGSATLTIRGVNNFLGGKSDSVTASLDGLNVLATDTSFFYTNALFDIERIEVLRGPQGTLSGGNSLGGALNYAVAKPDPSELSARIVADGSRFNTWLLDGHVNLPLSDRLALRFAGFVEGSDGAVRNAGPGGGSSGYNNEGGRVSLRWLPSEVVRFDISATLSRKRFGVETQLPIDVYDTPELRSDRIQELADLGGDYFDQDFFTDRGRGNNGGTILRDERDRTTTEMKLITTNLQFDLGNSVLDVSYSHYDFDRTRREDVDRSEFPVLRRDFLYTQKADSAELRWASDFSGPWNGVAGLAYINETLFFSQRREAGDGVSASSFETDFQAAQATFLERGAAYASVFFDATDKLRLTVGARLNRERLGFGYLFSGESFASPIGAGDIRRTVDFAEGTQNSFVPRIAANFQPTDDTTLYVQIARGIRSGFTNPDRAVEAGVAQKTVRPERLTNYEAGIKARLFEGRGSVSAAVFYADYTDLQVEAYSPTADGDYVYYNNNAAEAFSRGFEIEVAAQPTPAITVRGAVGYVHSRIRSVNSFGSLFEDVPVPGTRPWTASASVDYEPDVQILGLSPFGRLDYVYKGGTFGSLERIDSTRITDASIFNLTAGVRNDRLTVSGYFENLFDDQHWSSTSRGRTLRGTFVRFQPRSFGIRLQYRFGSS